MRASVVGVLGRGAHSVVELVECDDGTLQAHKRLALTGSAREINEARRRLRREAEVLTHLRAPGIVPVLAVEDDGTDVVIVMPVYARTLADRVAVEGPLPPAAVARLGKDLLAALSAAHRAGVVHRDVKPANVLLDATDGAALADFGIAGSREMTGGLTGEGVAIGTPRWMAPEQARGRRAGPASDVHALGATLHFAATGAAPGTTRRGRPVLGDDLPAWLRAALTSMLDPDPARRPPAAALLGGIDGTVVAAAPQRPPARRRAPRSDQAPHDVGRRRAARRLLLGRDGRPVPAAVLRLAGAAALVTAGVLTWALHQGGPAGPTGRRAAAPAPGACVARPFEACGSPPAPHTDGTSCLPGWYDLNAVADDGCEASSDWSPGRVLTSTSPVRANLVPPSAVDTFTARVDGHALGLCSGTLTLVLTAPPGATDRLEVRHGSTVVASTTSTDGRPATASVAKPGCFGRHSETLTLVVRSVAGATAADFTLGRHGGW